MGIADEADRTLFVGNLDPQVTEELLFELFLQAGPLIKVKIPKDNDGRSKQFGFINFKHEVSVPYGMNLLNGTKLFGRPLKIQFRAGSSHASQEGQSPAGSQNLSPSSTPVHRSGRYDKGGEEQMGSPPYSSPWPTQRFFSPPDLKRQAVMNTWQMQQNGGVQHQGFSHYGHGDSGYGVSARGQQDVQTQRGHRHAHQHESGSYYGREPRHPDFGSERHHRGQRNDYYHHDDRSGGGGGRSRDYSERHRDGSRDPRWRRY